MGSAVGTRGLWELAKQILKVSVIGLVLWVVITRTVEIVFESGLLSLSTLTEIAASEGTRLVQVVIAAGLAIAVADYFVSQRRVRRELMMSKREVKEELKQSEGDPLLRAALHQRALDASRNRMMVDVAMADVVLVNPTHVSVALKYNQAMGAPRVVAKGAGVVAARIREIATENRVPLVEDVPLARRFTAIVKWERRSQQICMPPPWPASWRSHDPEEARGPCGAAHRPRCGSNNIY